MMFEWYYALNQQTWGNNLNNIHFKNTHKKRHTVQAYPKVWLHPLLSSRNVFWSSAVHHSEPSVIKSKQLLAQHNAASNDK